MSFREDANFGQINIGGKDGNQGTTVKRIKVFSQTVTPGAVGIANASGTAQAFTVTGVRVGDKIIVNPAATGNATTVGAAFVSAANQVTIFYNNPTAGGLTPAAGTYVFIAIET